MQYQGSKKVLNRVPFRRFWDFTVAAWNKSCQTILDVLCKVKSGAEGGTRTLTVALEEPNATVTLFPHI